MTREEKKRATQQHIYDIAIDLFCEQGYAKTTLIDIANEAQVSTRTLYKYFKSKDSILRKFARENIGAMKAFTQELPPDMSLHDKVIETMVYDYKQMFCLFDVSVLLYAAQDKDRDQINFDFENLLITEGIYFAMLKDEQLANGVEPNMNTRIAATVLVGLYRMVCDQYRFAEHRPFDETRFRQLLNMHMDCIWESLHQSLLSEPTANYQRYFDIPRCVRPS